MPQLLVVPDILAAAAADVDAIGSEISAAGAAAAAPTTDVLAAAQDEVSAAVAKFFARFGLEYQAVVAKAAEFHNDFTQALAAAGNAYTQAEAANVAAGASTPVTALIMSGTGFPVPDPLYVALVNAGYIQPLFPGSTNPIGLTTPEQLWPAFGNLTFGQSVAQGVSILNNAITTQLQTGSVVVFGYSQSSVIASNVIRAFMAMGSGAPSPSDLTFMMIGALNNPDGGLFARYPGMYIPFLDIAFNGALPANNPYPTYIYTGQYDGFADNPQHPLNLVSDLNAFMGIRYVHSGYPVTPAGVATAVPLPTSPNYTGDTHYYMFLTQDLPLLQPIRNTPIVGPVIADLLQPDLRVLCDMGYGDLGTGLDYANVATPASLLAIPNLPVIAVDLARGAVQGSQAALVDIGLLPQTLLPDVYPYVPSLAPHLHVDLGQQSVTGLSLLSGALGSIFETIPPHTP